MIIVDGALERREAEGKPVRVGMVGAGYMARGMALQITKYMRGMELVAVANRTLSKAEQVCAEAGIGPIDQVDSVSKMEGAITGKRCAVTDNPLLICQAGNVDAIIEATGDVEYSAHVATEAIKNGKHIILMNAELDATVGPILKRYADAAGVVCTNVDGDQPGVVMNLLRWVKSIGYNPVLAGNIKGLQDHYRTPETQRGFAAQHHLTPQMATSFADGTKISMEMAVVANATGFRTGTRGMYGPRCSHVTEAANLFPLDQMLNGGMVDYVLGAEPGPGVFVLGYNDDPRRRPYMNYFKMGDGPLYVFYTPYHLPHLEAPLTVARAVLFNDAAATPLAGPVCDVIAIAKKDLKVGERLDGIGGFTCYGVLENSDICQRDGLLPMGLSEGCLLKRDVSKDEAIVCDDVEVPKGRLCDKLRAEQNEYFVHRV
jgi:predicted homoserine dehydrogenase-like protein